MKIIQVFARQDCILNKILGGITLSAENLQVPKIRSLTIHKDKEVLDVCL